MTIVENIQAVAALIGLIGFVLIVIGEILSNRK
jgi:hypothetical protein